MRVSITMNAIDHLEKYPYLKYAFYTYLMLGLTDVIHHFHAALILDDEPAIHAVYIGMVLLPLSAYMVVLHARYNKDIFLIVIISIAILAMLFPGIYHGGLHHFVKILVTVYGGNESGNISLLFPSDNLNLWFYELSGVLEFCLGLVLAYFLYKMLAYGAIKYPLIGSK